MYTEKDAIIIKMCRNYSLTHNASDFYLKRFLKKARYLEDVKNSTKKIYKSQFHCLSKFSSNVILECQINNDNSNTYLQTAGTLGLQEVLQGLEKAEAAKNNLSI